LTCKGDTSPLTPDMGLLKVFKPQA